MASSSLGQDPITGEILQFTPTVQGSQGSYFQPGQRIGINGEARATVPAGNPNSLIVFTIDFFDQSNVQLADGFEDELIIAGTSETIQVNAGYNVPTTGYDTNYLALGEVNLITDLGAELLDTDSVWFYTD